MHLMLRTIRSIFPIRSCDFALDDDVIARGKVKLCLDYHIQRCEGPCEGLVSREEYNAHIRQVEQLLKGKTRALQQELEQDMQRCAEALEFEKAAAIRNRVLALQKFRDKQKVAAQDFSDRDIVAVASAASDAVGVVFRVRDGNIVGKQHFTFTGADYEDEDEILEHLLQRYYGGTLDIPPEILLPSELETEAAFATWITEQAGMSVSIVTPKIGDKAKLLRMCQANAKYMLDEILVQKFKSDDFVPKSVQFLQRDLRLPATPRRIECFDISHFQGAETVASMVSFLDGKARKSEYRKFKIETVEGVDDFASMREVVRRRYTRVLEEGTGMPDLIVIDGGKGQLSSAVEVLTELGLATQPVIGLAKRLEEVFVPGESLPMNIPKTSPGLALLQRVRDEAHRFAITFHRARRTKATLQTELEEIDGVGPARAKGLLEKLGSVRAVQNASVEAIAEVIGWAAAKGVWGYFHEEEEGRSEGEGEVEGEGRTEGEGEGKTEGEGEGRTEGEGEGRTEGEFEGEVEARPALSEAPEALSRSGEGEGEDALGNERQDR
jgi:excinuclease ABC subunit C